MKSNLRKVCSVTVDFDYQWDTLPLNIWQGPINLNPFLNVLWFSAWQFFEEWVGWKNEPSGGIQAGALVEQVYLGGGSVSLPQPRVGGRFGGWREGKEGVEGRGREDRTIRWINSCASEALQPLILPRHSLNIREKKVKNKTIKKIMSKTKTQKNIYKSKKRTRKVTAFLRRA